MSHRITLNRLLFPVKLNSKYCNIFANGTVTFVDGGRVSQVGKCFNYDTPESKWTVSTF